MFEIPNGVFATLAPVTLKGLRGKEASKKGSERGRDETGITISVFLIFKGLKIFRDPFVKLPLL